MAVKYTLPQKDTDDELEHEIDYTKALLDVVGSYTIFSEVPKTRECLNMLEEVLVDIIRDSLPNWKVISKCCRFRPYHPDSEVPFDRPEKISGS